MQSNGLVSSAPGPFYIDKISKHHYIESRGYEQEHLMNKVMQLKNSNPNLSMPPAARILEDTRRAEA